MRSASARWPFASLLLLLLPLALAAQPHAAMHDSSPAPRRDSLSAMATVVATRVAPALAGRSRTELLATQPMLMLRAARWSGALQGALMLDAERWTMPDGEPVAGIWGEGFIDRRHPHTVVHEVMVSGMRRVGRLRLSLAAGKGIVPFGSDDPMVRPFTKYPANHHLAQVLERMQLVGALRAGSRVALEGAAFNGDEPAGPTAPPRWSRFADSRAGRITVWASPSLELQASTAFVRSPEFASGAGLDQRKVSASGRWARTHGVVRYALVEWARTEERYQSRRIFASGTLLGEAQAEHRQLSFALRIEQTTRPEEERLLDPFRTPRPPADLSIRGATRWRLAGVQAGTPLPHVGAVHASLFGELTYAHSTPVLRPVLLDPRDVIGAASAVHLSVGLRLGMGAMPARVGRYGAAVGSAIGGVRAMSHR